MKYPVLFMSIAGSMLFAAWVHGGWAHLLLWPALSFAIVGLGYFRLGPRIYGKSSSGLLSPLHQLVLLPYLVTLWSMWYAARLIFRQPAYHQLTDNIFIGRRLLPHELPEDIDHVIDLTCEFNEPKPLRSASYHSFQILDRFVTSPDQLQDWARQVAGLNGNIYIHCAEGQGRTGMFATVLLLHLGYYEDVDDALRFIQSKRPLVRLAKRQLALLRATQNAV